MEIMYVLDLLGTFAFAVTGAYKARMAKLHLVGIILLGIITAVGGGTVRDTISGRTPLFYLQDINYIVVAIFGCILTWLSPGFFRKGYSFFRLIDSIGLATFVIIGVHVSHQFLFEGSTSPSLLSSTTILLGIITGFGGGVIRDAIMGDIPLSLKKGSNYPTASLVGAASFYILMFWNQTAAIAISMTLTMILREIIAKHGLYKRVWKKKSLKKLFKI